ncbi:MAG: GNAT family N-acetyltransferase [Flavobacteriales bacterium]|nr:GNAT family N-acetyltransferase [Flavobacteriales bacterium]
MDSNLTIQNATPIDLDSIKQLFVNSIRNCCVQDYSTDQIEAWTSSVEQTDRWEMLMAEQYVIKAVMEHKIVGFASLKEGFYIDFIYVSHLHQNKGVATALYQHLKKKSKANGHAQLTSDVSITACTFFEKKGFKKVKENINIRSGIELINFHMVEIG